MLFRVSNLLDYTRGLRLELAYFPFDTRHGLGDLLGHLLHLVAHHAEAAPCFARVGGFNHGVHGEHLRIQRDSVDRLPGRTYRRKPR